MMKVNHLGNILGSAWFWMPMPVTKNEALFELTRPMPVATTTMHAHCYFNNDKLKGIFQFMY